MSTAAVDSRLSRFWRASIGKKVVMAVTGLVLFGFLIGHVIGNLQVFAGAEKINAYSEFLHHSPGILWGTRSILLVALILHVTAAVQLYAQKAAARPQKYAKWARRTSSLPVSSDLLRATTSGFCARAGLYSSSSLRMVR